MAATVSSVDGRPRRITSIAEAMTAELAETTIDPYFWVSGLLTMA